MSYKLSLLISECAVHETVFYSFKLVCKSLNGKTCQYSNNTFQKRQKSFSFAKLNSQTCKGPHRPDAIRNATQIFSFQKQIKPSTDKNFTRYADQIAKIAKLSRIFEKK